MMMKRQGEGAPAPSENLRMPALRRALRRAPGQGGRADDDALCRRCPTKSRMRVLS